MREPKKLRVTLPDFVIQTLESDIRDFKITQNGLLNEIFSLYAKERKEIQTIGKTRNNDVKQFNLNKKNQQIYDSTLKMYGIAVEAEFFRNIFYDYIDAPKYKRELLIFAETVREIELAIKKSKKIEIIFGDNKESRIIEPYFIKAAGGESRNYLHCFCEKSNDFRNFRITNINVLRVLNEKHEKYDSEKVNNARANYDPFGSYSKEVKVRLSEKGKRHYDMILTNRPNIKESYEDVYTFYCSEENAKIYFPHFMDEAEILEPQELREWFRERFERVLHKYEKKLEDIK